MKIQQLYEYIVLAELLNFTKASQKLCITQPVLSRHIKELEEYFNAELLMRDTHRVQLTTTGELVLSEARNIICQFEKSLATINLFTGNSKQKLSIVYLGEAVHHILGDIVQYFTQRHPNINTSFRDCELEEAINFLKSGEYDGGFLLRPNEGKRFEEFDAIPFLTDPLCIAVNKEHPLANRSTVSIKELIDYPIIREDPKEFMFSDIFNTSFFKRYNLDFKLHHEYPNLKTCLFNIEINKEIVLLLPKHRLSLLGKNTTLVDIEEKDCFYYLEFAWNKKNTNPSLMKFIREFRQFLHNLENFNYTTTT